MNPAVGGILTLGTYDKCLELSGTSGNYFLMRWNDSNGKKCRLSPKGLGGGAGDVRVVQISLAVGLSKMPHSPKFHHWFWKPNQAAVFTKTT